jgi:hypothetical protein
MTVLLIGLAFAFWGYCIVRSGAQAEDAFTRYNLHTARCPDCLADEPCAERRRLANEGVRKAVDKQLSRHW